MRTPALAAACLLLLAACQQSGNTSVTRVSANGVDTLYSRTTVVDGVARFACIASRSGQCHYLVLDPRCTLETACAQPPLQQFAVAVGQTRAMPDLPTGFKLCVSEVRKERCHRD
ncbi:hypothetical protein [Stenotrophomonas sp.]|uniref:hypothetical protein n=1 Tax=Stenotrophomonas sp. TaxID=69392 RepID=UPI0028B0E946|nr:hypothetical protein [Stenotrophomonas sp.]